MIANNAMLIRPICTLFLYVVGMMFRILTPYGLGTKS